MPLKNQRTEEQLRKVENVNPVTYNPVGKELPESIRRVIIRLWDQGHSVSDISTLIGVTAASVSKYVQRQNLFRSFQTLTRKLRKMLHIVMWGNSSSCQLVARRKNCGCRRSKCKCAYESRWNIQHSQRKKFNQK